MGALLLTAVAPVALRGGGSDNERVDLRRILGREEEDTLAPFVLRRDKRYVFSPDRKAAIAFRYLHGVGLAAGDPIGDPASFGAVVGAFLALCERMGWRPAVVGAREDRLSVYAAKGLRTVYIGDEAVIDVAAFTLEGRPMRNVRQSVNHARRAGVATEMYREGDLDVRLRRQLLKVAAAQRNDAPEYGFSMALGEHFSGRYPECFVIVARNASGEPIGFQRYVPCRAGKAFSLDSMRRLPGSTGGVNELMIVDAVAWAKARELEALSLNFSAFRTLLDSEAELERLQSIAAWTIRRFEGKFGVQLDSLRRFNAKFLPRWVPRYVVYRSPGDIPAIGLAAYSAEGFLPFDSKSRLQAAMADG
jgi:lysyl-tRNA synthetase class 2